MNVDRHVERCGGREDVPELLVVQVLALRVRVDDGAFEAQRPHAALELLGSRCGILWRDGGQPRVARGMSGDGRRELVVRCARERGARRRVEDLHAGRGDRQDLHVDPGRIHVVDAPRAQVLQALADEARALAGIFEVVAHEAVEPEVVRTLARQQLAVGADQVFRGERFFGGDAFEAEVTAQGRAPVVRPQRPVVGPARAGVATERRRAFPSLRAPSTRDRPSVRRPRSPA